MTIASIYPIRPSKVLPIIADKVEMVQGMMSRAIDHVFKGVVCDHIGVVNEYGPKVNCHEETKIEMPLNGKNEDEKMIRDRLRVTINWVEGVRCVWGRNYI
jgi:hypothetical protein